MSLFTVFVVMAYVATYAVAYALNFGKLTVLAYILSPVTIAVIFLFTYAWLFEHPVVDKKQ